MRHIHVRYPTLGYMGDSPKTKHKPLTQTDWIKGLHHMEDGGEASRKD
ncbi:hypothetical protein [Porphyromonas catoniae]